MNRYPSIIVANTLKPEEFLWCADNDLQSLLKLAAAGQTVGMRWDDPDPTAVIARLVDLGVGDMSLVVIDQWPALCFEPESFSTKGGWRLAIHRSGEGRDGPATDIGE